MKSFSIHAEQFSSVPRQQIIKFIMVSSIVALCQELGKTGTSSPSKPIFYSCSIYSQQYCIVLIITWLSHLRTGFSSPNGYVPLVSDYLHCLKSTLPFAVIVTFVDVVSNQEMNEQAWLIFLLFFSTWQDPSKTEWKGETRNAPHDCTKQIFVSGASNKMSK